MSVVCKIKFIAYPNKIECISKISNQFRLPNKFDPSFILPNNKFLIINANYSLLPSAYNGKIFKNPIKDGVYTFSLGSTDNLRVISSFGCRGHKIFDRISIAFNEYCKLINDIKKNTINILLYQFDFQRIQDVIAIEIYKQILSDKYNKIANDTLKNILGDDYEESDIIIKSNNLIPQRLSDSQMMSGIISYKADMKITKNVMEIIIEEVGYEN